VALSLKSPSLGVTQHPALWSPDFPQARLKPSPRPLNLLTQIMIARPVEGVKARPAPDSRSSLRVPANSVYFG
jgi:hypothetical protein